ncbi:hypothetical protein [Bifidobacterium erythrocebi]|nr:hypothetical protein [Bifidobacterium sp. DSM 109960]
MDIGLPDQLSIIGFNDVHPAASMYPARQPSGSHSTSSSGDAST